MSKNGAGFYFFKFKDDEGLNEVMENGPWLIDQVPIFLHKWEPGISLAKIEPKRVPVWVAINDVPHDQWSNEGISLIASAIGRPLLMDRVTRDTCINKEGRFGFARILVELDAEEDVPRDVEVEYPPMRGRPGFITSLRVSYQWKPNHCAKCKIFGHNISSHDIPMQDVDRVHLSKDSPNDSSTEAPKAQEKPKDDGFTIVEKKKAKGKKQGLSLNVKQKSFAWKPKPKEASPSAVPEKPIKVSPPRTCTLNTSNMFDTLDEDDEDEDIEDVYEEDDRMHRFMSLEDEYC